MTSYNKYHKKHNEKKKSAGYKKITFEVNSEENILSNQIKQELKDKGINKTNKDLYMDGLMLNRDRVSHL
jgi:hypothetical protein